MTSQLITTPTTEFEFTMLPSIRARSLLRRDILDVSRKRNRSVILSERWSFVCRQQATIASRHPGCDVRASRFAMHQRTFSKAFSSASSSSTHTPGDIKAQRLREFGIHNDIKDYRQTWIQPVATSSDRNVRVQESKGLVRVQSLFAARAVDVNAVLTKVFSATSINPSRRHMFDKYSLIVHLPSGSAENSRLDSFAAVYRFGPVVFFNVKLKQAAAILEQIKKHGYVAR